MNTPSTTPDRLRASLSPRSAYRRGRRLRRFFFLGKLPQDPTDLSEQIVHALSGGRRDEHYLGIVLLGTMLPPSFPFLLGRLCGASFPGVGVAPALR